MAPGERPTSAPSNDQDPPAVAFWRGRPGPPSILRPSDHPAIRESPSDLWVVPLLGDARPAD
jgi:hypothetical protein